MLASLRELQWFLPLRLRAVLQIIIMTELAKSPLRERKHVQTRLNLSSAAIQQLETHTLESISIKKLADQAMVSEATFFNYFAKKSDLIAYISQLWMLDLCWHAQQFHTHPSGLQVITKIFEHAGVKMQAQPGLIGEIIAFQAHARAKVNLPTLSALDKMMAYPNVAAIEEVPAHGIDKILALALDKAVGGGELPSNTHTNTVLINLVSIFLGVPLVLRLANPAGIGNAYRHQLSILWKGLTELTVANNT